MAKLLKESWVILWDRDSDGVIDEVEGYWVIGTSDDLNLNKEFKRRYTMQTTFINPTGDLTNIGTTTVNQLILTIKNDVKGLENIT